jgi:hypothetical protein
MPDLEVHFHGNRKMARAVKTKTMKLVNHLGLTAQGMNPLFNLEVEVPSQECYFFDDKDMLVDSVSTNDAEAMDAAFTCLQILNQENLVGGHATALFEEKFGKLVRKQIVCTCNKPNYCDPNAPEYQKPWKPANNAGCVSCKSNCLPETCDCNFPEPTPPPKVGCVTRIRTGNVRSYQTGSMASRKVC